MNQFNKTLKALTILVLFTLVMASCKSQKAVLDTTPKEEVDIEETTPRPDPEPEKEEPKEPEIKPAPEPTLDARLSDYFSEISSASSVSVANNNIREALRLFGSSDAPVLIVFYQANGKEDYDEPTTITKYLNYLKDLKKDPHKVKEIIKDDQGRIKELVLIKK